MKMDAFAEMFLWNRNIDGLIRVLQRLEPLSIRPKQEMKAYEIRLEEIRAGLNADFAEAMVRSMVLSGTNGPRSLTRIAEACRVWRFVTTISEPMGSVRCAAVSASSLKTCPFAAFRPL